MRSSLAGEVFSHMKGPPEFHRFLDSAYASIAETETPDRAEKMVYRKLQLAGWYKTPNGWRKVGPDLQDKVNFRQAIEQPDGTFVIFDVDVFYPNAAKGGEDENIYTPERVLRAAENTNRSIVSGGQQPGLTLGHPHPLKKILGDGQTLPVYGRAINWRSSPRGSGWLRVDLVRVDRKVMEDWKKGRYIGLSAGFVEDAGTNERFGHVAILGADMQQLSYLPMVEVTFAAASQYSGNQVFFSTDSQAFTKGSTMPLNLKNASHKKAYDALKTAFAAFEAGEPGADVKFSAAKKDFDALFAGEQPPASPPPAGSGGGAAPGGGGASDEELINEILQAGGGEGGSGEPDGDEGGGTPPTDDHSFASNPSEETVLPDEPELNSGTPNTDTNTEVPAGKGGGNFSAGRSRRPQLQNFDAEITNHPIVQNLQQQIERLTGVVNTQRRATAVMAGERIVSDLRQFCAEMAQSGRVFDSDATLKAMVKVASNPEALTSLKDMITKLPVDKTLVSGATFAADGTSRLRRQNEASADGTMTETEVDEMRLLLRKHGRGNFSAEDIKLYGNIGANVVD